MSNSRRDRLLLVIGVAVTVALLAWTLRDVSVAEILAHLASARPLPLLVAVLLLTLTFPLRVFRWAVILRAGDGPRLLPLWHAIAVGFMANNLLPLRVGEVARAYVGARLTAIRFPTTLSSLALERALDAAVILTLLALPLTLSTELSGISIAGQPLLPGLQLMGVGFVSALVVAGVMSARPGPALRLTRAVAGSVLPRRLAARVVSLFQAALEGFRVLRDLRRTLFVACWTFVIWLTNALGIWFGLVAFGIDVPASAALLVNGFIALGVALPSSPGFFGPFEAATRAALELYGVAPAPAVAFAVGLHIAGFVPITLLGLFSLRRAQLRLADLRKFHDASPVTASTEEAVSRARSAAGGSGRRSAAGGSGRRSPSVAASAAQAAPKAPAAPRP